MDDRRVGLIIRALRRRRGWRQADLAAAAHLSQPAISLVERGHAETMSLRTLRRILLALEARGEFEIRWRGGSLDRTLDERHAALVATVIRSLKAHGWESAVEVTYAVYGERGSIDVLGFHRQAASLLVIEVKTELTSVEETLRRLDEKVRLSGRIARDRLGWIAAATSCLLVMPDTAAARRRAFRHRVVLEAAVPAGNVAIRHWLMEPKHPLRGRWFLANMSPRSAGSRQGGPDRVIRSAGPGIRAGSRSVRSDSAALRQSETGESSRLPA